MKLKRIAIDISQQVFALHGVDEQERPVVRRNLKRARMHSFLAKREATEVVLRSAAARTIGDAIEQAGPLGSPHSAATRQAVRQAS